ncbi:hypothetical protein, partial [Flavobacterium sp.]|uniref:hypothetical protein n=1 Tax=Flavobacterium sp. TaxID=239 RepID=UPI0037BFEE07
MKFLIIELTTGLLDGFYTSIEGARLSMQEYQKEFPDLLFTVHVTNRTLNLHDSELIRFSDW